MPQEIEIKYRLAAAHIDLLIQHPYIKKYSQHSPTYLHLVNTYFDTIDCRLAQQGFGLRIREVAGQYLLTLKQKSTDIGDQILHAHHEWEYKLKKFFLDFNGLSDLALRSDLEKLRQHDLLKPIFTTNFDRIAWQLNLSDDESAELVLDRGQIRCDDKTLAFCEIEIELKQGKSGLLFDIAEELSQDINLEAENQSKAARGYQLFGIDKRCF